MRHPKIAAIIDTPETREFLKALFNKNLLEGEDKTSVLRFTEALADIVRDEVGFFRGKRPTAAAGNNNAWRSTLKALFSGRGRQWIFVSLQEIKPTLIRLEGMGVDTSQYQNWITNEGKAWVRFSGPRIYNGKNSAAFEVRTLGSRIDHPKQLHYIDAEEIKEENLDRLVATPWAMGKEVFREISPPPEDEIDVSYSLGDEDEEEEEIVE